MLDLTCSYLGLELANPLVPSSSPLTGSTDTARHLEDAGAAAIVMPSLFEEVIIEEQSRLDRFLDEQSPGPRGGRQLPSAAGGLQVPRGEIPRNDCIDEAGAVDPRDRQPQRHHQRRLDRARAGA
jgi:hypothetical protein